MLALVPLPVALIFVFKEEKGDVRKTICALNIEAGLNELKKRVLSVDFAQGLKSLYSYLSYLFNLMILYL